MYVCLCTGVNSETVTQVVAAGARTSQEVADACGAGSVCGRCRSTVRRIIAAELAAAGEAAPAALVAEEAAGWPPEEAAGWPPEGAPSRPRRSVPWRTRLVEVRTYAVRPADAERFHERVVLAGLPLLGEQGVDVVHFGPSETPRDQAVDFVLIRSFPSRRALERLEVELEGSARWRAALGADAADAVVEERQVALLLPVDAVDGLRSRLRGADFTPEAGTV
ncbi:MAG TPA: (2Fe-2S)-binding protein [Intrasporangium sp.]|uniref:(2Fe-2S)-binding protein n=1 Tax=Intrasporangium sp. TaxID=1925024 RepID=UPI002D79A49B|nr:(2Fe-2S)-binding protein [Intrasporangium sp.]HET7398671.1 (2Fe-2S)-binding protein [Intrasporangium sp.]